MFQDGMTVAWHIMALVRSRRRRLVVKGSMTHSRMVLSGWTKLPWAVSIQIVSHHLKSSEIINNLKSSSPQIILNHLQSSQIMLNLSTFYIHVDWLNHFLNHLWWYFPSLHHEAVKLSQGSRKPPDQVLRSRPHHHSDACLWKRFESMIWQPYGSSSIRDHVVSIYS